MESYKIRIPNQEISEKVQLKAFELGYKWKYAHNGNVKPYNLTSIFLYESGEIKHSSDENCWNNPRNTNKEISYQDFLAIGEEKEVIYYKVRLNDGNDHRNLDQKLKSIGFSWNSRDWDFIDQFCIGLYLYPDRMKLTRSVREDIFNESSNTEISVEDIMSINSIEELTTKITQKNESMEITLVCVKEPKAAKNITKDQEYVGILIDAEGTQVDSFKEATHFLCTNNSGNEARYSINLFAEPRRRVNRPERVAQQAPVQPVPAPAPVIPSVDEYLAFLNIGDNLIPIVQQEGHSLDSFTPVNFPQNAKVILLQNNGNGGGIVYTILALNVDRTAVIRNYPNIVLSGSNISCGVRQLYGIANLLPSIQALVANIVNLYRVNYNIALSQQQINTLIFTLFKSIIKAVLNSNGARFGVASCHHNVDGLVELMNSINATEEVAEGMNDNSHNQISVWVINKDFQI